MLIRIALFAIAFPLAAQTPHSVTLNWHPTLGGTPTGYHVKRAPQVNGAFVLIATVPGTSYIDNASATNLLPEGTTPCYVITALRPDGTETDPSNQVCATIPIETITPPFLDSAVAK
jgi:hypothetical protein